MDESLLDTVNKFIAKIQDNILGISELISAETIYQKNPHLFNLLLTYSKYPNSTLFKPLKSSKVYSQKANHPKKIKVHNTQGNDSLSYPSGVIGSQIADKFHRSKNTINSNDNRKFYDNSYFDELSHSQAKRLVKKKAIKQKLIQTPNKSKKFNKNPSYKSPQKQKLSDFNHSFSFENNQNYGWTSTSQVEYSSQSSTGRRKSVPMHIPTMDAIDYASTGRAVKKPKLSYDGNY